MYFTFIVLFKGLDPLSAEVADKDEMPKLLVFGIALVGLGLLLANTALVAWFIIRKRIKGKTFYIFLIVLYFLRVTVFNVLCLHFN